jgi:hypothetical protein
VPWHRSSKLQAFPSSQVSPSLTLSVQVAVPLQLLSTQISFGQLIACPPQTPLTQVSLWVQTLPSSQAWFWQSESSQSEKPSQSSSPGKWQASKASLQFACPPVDPPVAPPIIAPLAPPTPISPTDISSQNFLGTLGSSQLKTSIFASMGIQVSITF